MYRYAQHYVPVVSMNKQIPRLICCTYLVIGFLMYME